MQESWPLVPCRMFGSILAYVCNKQFPGRVTLETLHSRLYENGNFTHATSLFSSYCYKSQPILILRKWGKRGKKTLQQLFYDTILKSLESRILLGLLQQHQVVVYPDYMYANHIFTERRHPLLIRNRYKRDLCTDRQTQTQTQT